MVAVYQETTFFLSWYGVLSLKSYFYSDNVKKNHELNSQQLCWLSKTITVKKLFIIIC